MKKSLYEQLGVQSDKSDIAQLFAKITRNDFPGAFCKIVRMSEFPGYVMCKHPDGVGSLSLTRFLLFLETGDPKVLRGDANNALEMNLGDISCCGFFRRTIYLTDNIDINGLLVSKNIFLREFAYRMVELIELFRQHGIIIYFIGGETADLTDQLHSVVLNMDACSTLKEEDAIIGNVQSTDKIWGFYSAGQAVWEEKENSGVASNGATGLRTLLLHVGYALKNREICPRDFRGRFFFHDKLPGTSLNIGQALTSPTRHLSLLIKLLCEKLESQGVSKLLHGVSMNTGGGLTKVGRLGKGIRYEMKVPTPPPIFQLVQDETGESWEQIYRTYNSGIIGSIVGSDEGGIIARAIKEVSAETGVPSYELGECSRYDMVDQNMVILKNHVNGDSYSYPIKLDH